MVTDVSTMTLDGGVECLDFVNSGYDLQKDVVCERLHSYDDLLILLERLNIFDANCLASLNVKAEANQNDAENALQSAREIRGLLYSLFAGIATKSHKKSADNLLRQINDLFLDAFRYKQLVIHDGHLHFSFQWEAAGLMAPVWRFVLSALDLLNTGNLQYVRQCQRCAWLFYDQTKNHRKKWCSMESCGNREKTKRYYKNKKQVL